MLLGIVLMEITKVEVEVASYNRERDLQLQEVVSILARNQFHLGVNICKVRNGQAPKNIAKTLNLGATG